MESGDDGGCDAFEDCRKTQIEIRQARVRISQARMECFESHGAHGL